METSYLHYFGQYWDQVYLTLLLTGFEKLCINELKKNVFLTVDFLQL